MPGIGGHTPAAGLPTPQAGPASQQTHLHIVHTCCSSLVPAGRMASVGPVPNLNPGSTSACSRGGSSAVEAYPNRRSTQLPSRRATCRHT